MKDKLPAMLEAGYIERLHAVPHHQSYSVAHHSWNMLILLHELFPDPGPSKRLMLAITFHDVAERWMGDVPTTAKWSSPELKAAIDKLEKDINDRLGLTHKLNENEKAWLKGLDLLELFLYCQHDKAMGNQHLLQIEKNCHTILTKNDEVPKEIRAFAMNFIWKRTDNLWREK